MALSNSVEQSLNEASAHLRNALAYAARNERPFVCTQISGLLSEIENITSMDSIFDTLEKKIKNIGGNDKYDLSEIIYNTITLHWLYIHHDVLNDHIFDTMN